MKSVIAICIALIGMSLPGCAISDWGSAGTGGAVYEYQHITAGGDSCTLRITSARNVAGGDITIGPDCELDSRADDAGGAYSALERISEIAAEVVQ